MSSNQRKVCFLDRDGVINDEIEYLHKISDFRFTYRCLDALKSLQNKGFELVVITNQAGIGKGYFTHEDYFKLTEYYRSLAAAEGIEFLDVLYCPHHPEATLHDYRCQCEFRKPNPGMINKIVKKYDVDLENSILVGDKRSDMLAGENAGLKNLFMVSSGHAISEQDSKSWPCFKNLYAVSTTI